MIADAPTIENHQKCFFAHLFYYLELFIFYSLIGKNSAETAPAGSHPPLGPRLSTRGCQIVLHLTGLHRHSLIGHTANPAPCIDGAKIVQTAGIAKFISIR